MGKVNREVEKMFVPLDSEGVGSKALPILAQAWG